MRKNFALLKLNIGVLIRNYHITEDFQVEALLSPSNV